MGQRKTIDTWELHVNYGLGHGWECECVEFSRADMRVTRDAYRGDCMFPIRVVRKRMKISMLSEHERSTLGITSGK
jgi:hypothetical protein